MFIEIEMSENKVHIIEFRDELVAHFKNLNIAWLEKYFYVEAIDEAMLSDPKKYIIDKGGYIFFAEMDNEIAGTFALMKVEERIFELAKMAVDEKFQGRRVGNRMMEFAIEKVKNLSATKLILYSNTMLSPAIHLYKKYGFVEVPFENSEYKRSNIKMVLALTPDASPLGEGGRQHHSIPGVTLHEGASNVLFGYSKNLRQELTSAEQLMWDNLRNRKIDDLKFRRQHPIGKYIADFYCHQKLLVIELDGSIHNLPENKDYDRARDEYFRELGITVLRFTNEEVLGNMSSVLKKIRESARKINIQSNPTNE
jgi:very-short-patch-repair endonuclease/ribosomal protein S18 acetylase RimI-like enzyme